jgi:hypothetical protein
MKLSVFLCYCLLSAVTFSQTNKKTTTSTKTTVVKTTVTKPAAVPVNSNIVGSFFMNYEIKNQSEPIKTGKVFYASDNNQVLISPSFSGLKDVANIRMLIDLKEKEMTMLTTDSKNKKSGLLTLLPKPILNKTTTVKKPPVVTKTGIYKTIQGFKCEKILVNLGDTVNIEAYVTTEIIMDFNNLVLLTNSSLRSKSPFTSLSYDVKGTMLESIISKKNGDITRLSVSDIKKGKPDAAAFSTNGYNIMDARGLPMFNNAQ